MMVFAKPETPYIRSTAAAARDAAPTAPVSQSRDCIMSFKAGVFQFAVIAALFMAAGSGAAAARTIQLVGFGDSLMAGYQLPPGDGFPEKLEAALKAKGVDVAIANAGVSGDTTGDGLARIDWSVPDGTDGVILELGANDALRGIAPEESEKNLEAIISRLRERGIAILLVGMLAPPNMGGDYAARFNPIYQRLAYRYGLTLYPFFLDGVVTHSELQLTDGMHPNSQGVDTVVQRFLPVAVEFVGTVASTLK
jgi:acyl-CoA thioesterase-1